MHDPLILTALCDARTQGIFNELREAYFPPARNMLDAHVTLFHALPGAQLPWVVQQLEALAETQAPLPFSVSGPFSLGHGVALRLQCPPLVALRNQLTKRCDAAEVPLTKQDQAPLRPHVTVQNKVSLQDARRTLEAITMAWDPSFSGHIEGLGLWHYRGGPWELAHRVAFAGEKTAP